MILTVQNVGTPVQVFFFPLVSPDVRTVCLNLGTIFFTGGGFCNAVNAIAASVSAD